MRSVLLLAFLCYPCWAVPPGLIGAWTPGKLSPAPFTKNSSRVVVTPSIPLTQTFSVSAWVNPAAVGVSTYARIAETQWDHALYLGVDASGKKYKWIVNAGSGSGGSCGVALGCAEGGTVSTGWHLVTGTYDGTIGKLYVDGLLVASDTFTSPGNTNLPLFIGRYYNGDGFGWTGNIDEVTLYGRALTVVEVSNLFASSSGPFWSLAVIPPPIVVTAGDDWPMGLHDSKHTGTSAEVIKPPLTVAWTWKDPYPYDNGTDPGFKVTPQKAFWLPIYYRGLVCWQGGLNANQVFCRNATDGSAAWEAANPCCAHNGIFLAQFYNYPAAAAGRLLYVSSDFTISLNAADGTDQKGVYNVYGGWPYGGGAVTNDKVAYQHFVLSDGFSDEEFNIMPDPSVISFAGTGAIQPDNVNTFWDSSNPYGSGLNGTRVPAVDAGIAYTNFLGQLRAWNATTAALLWTWGTQNYGASPAVANGIVYFYASSTSQLMAFKGSPPAVVWSAAIPGAYSPIVSNGLLYVGSSDKNFYCLDAATGAVKWKLTTGSPFGPLALPAISGGLIYIPGADGVLYVLDKLTGSEVWRYAGTAAWGPVVIGGGMVYVSDLTSTMYAFKPVLNALPSR